MQNNVFTAHAELRLATKFNVNDFGHFEPRLASDEWHHNIARP
jgi:hypothetical protein